MAQLVLLVVAAAWAAVLIPPLLRSRIDNRPNSSVTDFRRQLNTLQNTSSPSRGALRMGRPLAQSPLQRPAAGGRPGHHPHHRQASLHGGTVTQTRAPEARSFRSHGDPSGGHHRPTHTQTHMDRRAPQRTAERPPARRAVDPRADLRRRRTNILFLLVITTACTLFLYWTTKSAALMYAFVLSFLALGGYVLLLAQARQRERTDWNNDWIERY